MKEKLNRYREEELETNTEGNEEEVVAEVTENKEDELLKMTNSYLRVLADYENFKKRTNEERIKERKYVYQSLFEKLINVIDIFDKAVNMQTDDEKLKNFLMGFKMINDNLKQILEAEGVKKIITLDQKFVSSYH